MKFKINPYGAVLPLYFTAFILAILLLAITCSPAPAAVCYYNVPATVYGIVDADTFDARINPWLNLYLEARIRVADVDAPEKKDEAAFNQAKEFARKWLGNGEVLLTTCRRDSFGRVLAQVNRNGRSLANDLIEGGFAKPWTRKQVIEPLVSQP